jgi:hypothetical protein
VPDGSNWKATMLIEYPDPHERKRELARLIGVEDRMFVEVEGHARVYAIADEDLDRENDEKTSAVHFVRFEFTPAQRQAVRAGAGVKLGCDHTNYPAHVQHRRPRRWPALAGDLTTPCGSCWPPGRCCTLASATTRRGRSPCCANGCRWPRTRSSFQCCR